MNTSATATYICRGRFIPSWPPKNWITVFAVRTNSENPKTTKPSEVSFTMTTSWLISAGSMIRNAWGSRIMRIVCSRVSPTAIAASGWPLGSAATPARRISAMITQL